jgi:hypothetical protein
MAVTRLPEAKPCLVIQSLCPKAPFSLRLQEEFPASQAKCFSCVILCPAALAEVFHPRINR